MPRLRRIASSQWFPVVVVTLGVFLLYVIAGHHQELSRQDVINAVLTPQEQHTRHYEEKLVRESDLEAVAPDVGHVTGPDFYVWVVAVSGDFGIHGEYGGPITWGVALVKDQRPVELMETISGSRGNWPPFFDSLIDLGN